jgi:hypothetical protein
LTKRVIVVLGLLLTGCTASTEAEQPPPAPRIEVSGLPATFTSTADWSLRVRPGSTVQATDAGILVLRSAGASAAVVSVLNPATGGPRWQSVPIPVTKVPPLARITSDEGHPWVVVESTTDATTTLWVFDAYAGGRDVQPTQGRKFEGAGGKPPVVTITDRGVLVTGLKDNTPIVYRPASGVAQVFATHGEVPLRSYGTSVLAAIGTGFGLIAEKVGWLSTDRVPPGVAANATATVVAVDGAFVAAVWTGKDKRTTLALHELLTGKVRATSQLTANEPAQPFVVARDGAWAGYGSRAFNLSTGAETALPGGLRALTQIQDGVAYGTSAAGPVAIDLLTGTTMDRPAPTAVPADFDGLGHGLFVLGDLLYAVPLKRWRP